MISTLISIIVPVFNVEKYLQKCIDSILAQDYFNFELILVDDGSRDSSSGICDEYARRDSRVRVIHQKNAGVSAARNTGLDTAHGEWIAFVDSDDWVLPNYISSMFRNSKPNALVVGQYKYAPKDTEVYTNDNPQEITLKELWFFSFFTPFNVRLKFFFCKV